MPKKKNVILGVTGSIAIYKACEITRCLDSAGITVTVVMTKEAEEFIRPVLFEGLSGNPAYRGLFEEPKAWEIGHVSLAKKADLILLAPATANIIAKIACGISDDLLTCVVCATRAPLLICPAMNENMYTNKIVGENIKKLKSLGYKFVEPIKGRLACKEVGVGCLAEVEAIVKAVKQIIK